MAAKAIVNFTNKLEADPPPSEERKNELIVKCLKVCSTLSPEIYSIKINQTDIIEFAQKYTHQLNAESLNTARPFLATIVEKYNTYSIDDYVYIRGFNDKYLLTDESALGAAIKARNEDDIIALLSAIPISDYKFIGKKTQNLLFILTKHLLVKPIQHLGSVLSDLEFEEIYNFSKDEITESPIEYLGSRTYDTTEKLARARAIAKVFLTKNVPTSGSDITQLKSSRIYPTLPADLARIKTRRSERRSPAKRAIPYPTAYFILGHGGDYNFHTPYRIPTDSAIIAKGTSGQLLSASKTDAYAPLYDLHTKPYINPLKKDNILYLIDKYKYFSLFTEQSYYPNFTYTLLSTFPQDDYYRLAFSGIIKYPFRTLTGELIEPEEVMNATHIPKSDKLSAHVDKFVHSYKYSIYPKKQIVKDLIDSYIFKNPDITVEEFVNKAEREPNNIINVTQQFLFTTLPPGIFYNFVCRASLFTKKLYQNGFIVDDSMRGFIVDSTIDNLEVRGGLQQIISEALTTRAGIIKAAMKAAEVEDESAGLVASASAGSAISPSIASRFVKMRAMIIKLRQKFSNEKFFEFIEYLQPRVAGLLGSVTDEIVVENQQYISEHLPDFFEKITKTRDNYITVIKFLNELYIEGHIVMEGGEPTYLRQLEITDELEEYISQQTNDALIERFKNKPVYVLEYMKNGYLLTLFHLAIQKHKYKFAKWLFEKSPRFSKVYVPMFNIKPFYFDILKIKGAYAPAYEPLRDIITQSGNTIKSLFVVAQLNKNNDNDGRAIYKIFEQYILDNNLDALYPSIRETMVRFGMIAAPAAPAASAQLKKTIAALRAKIPNPENSNSNSSTNTTRKNKSASSKSSRSSSTSSSGKGKKTIKNLKKPSNNSSNSE